MYKINLFVEELPEDGQFLRLHSLSGLNRMIDEFKQHYTPIYYANRKREFAKKDFASFQELCTHYISFFSTFNKLTFIQYYPYLLLQCDSEQMVYLSNLNILKENDLIQAAKNYDACQILKLTIEEEKLAKQAEEEARLEEQAEEEARLEKK